MDGYGVTLDRGEDLVVNLLLDLGTEVGLIYIQR